MCVCGQYHRASAALACRWLALPACRQWPATPPVTAAVVTDRHKNTCVHLVLLRKKKCAAMAPTHPQALPLALAVAPPARACTLCRAALRRRLRPLALPLPPPVLLPLYLAFAPLLQQDAQLVPRPNLSACRRGPRGSLAAPVPIAHPQGLRQAELAQHLGNALKSVHILL